MAGEKKRLEEKNTDTPGSTRSLRDNAEEQLARSPKHTPNLLGKTPEQLIHELQVHQIELETQAEDLRKSKIALEESRDKYLDLYEYAPVGYFILTNDALIAEVNLSAATLLGVNRNKLEKTRFRKFVDPEDFEMWDLYFMAVRNHENRLTTTLMVKRGDGTTFPARLESVRLTGLYDRATAVRVAISDISDMKEVEEALRESEKRFHSMFERHDSIMLLIDPKTGNIIDANLAAEQFYGRSRKDICAQSIVDINSLSPDEISAEMMKAAQEHNNFFTFQHRLASGETRTVEVHSSPIDLGGKMLLFSIINDITERKRVEKALQESETKLQMALFGSETGMWELDIPSMTSAFDDRAAQILGYPRQDIGPKITDWDSLLHPEDLPHTQKRLVDCLEGYIDFFKSEYRMRHASGEWVWVIGKGKITHRNQDGSPLRISGTLQNITERKELEKKMECDAQGLRQYTMSLAAANKKLNILSSITRHDINNQLTVQMGYLSILEKKEIGITHNEYFLKVSTAAKRIAAMIQFTKEYEEIGVHAPAWQDTRTLVETAIKQATPGKVIVKNDLPTGTEVFADPLVSKVFYNLMDNAVRYGGKITTIRFSAQESGDDHLIVCEDDGDGVVAAEKEKIFERGFGKNTGLGLALSREILDITGITITETGEPGQGARFEMAVPKGAWRMNPDTNEVQRSET